MQIAIDGTAGSGKGTLSQRLSNKLNIPHLDTGLLYRKVAFTFINNYGQNLDINRNKSLEKIILIAKNSIHEVISNQYLRDNEVGLFASKIANIKELREILKNEQIKFAEKNFKKYGGCILDGRDIGTKILPNAYIKFFIIASAEIRAKRRLLEKESSDLHPNEQKCIFNKILKEIIIRDKNDYNREHSPLKKAKDAIEIDTTKLTPNEVENRAIEYINDKIK